MSNRLPVFLFPWERREVWEALLWEAGFEPLGEELPDPVADPEKARRFLKELKARALDSPTDALMGLPGRRRSLLRLEDEVGTEGEPLWLGLINLDHFKHINDNFGHTVGEEVLTEWGRLLVRDFDHVPVLGRFGGDAVLVALRGERDDVRGRLERHLESLRGSGFSEKFLLTASVGLARHRPGEEVDELLDRADRNLYAAKNRGRNRVVDEHQFAEGTTGNEVDFELADFENRVRVFADRLISGLSGRGRRMVESSRDEADHDGLTGLYNRRYFDRRLVREVQRSRKLGSPLTLVLLDLDDFAVFNRAHGYPQGDEALKAAAQVVLRGIRVVDWAGRFGGEEICAVFPDTGIDIAATIAERMRHMISELNLDVEIEPLSLSVSVGVVSLREDDAGAPRLLERAVEAVRQSQKTRNAVTVDA